MIDELPLVPSSDISEPLIEVREGRWIWLIFRLRWELLGGEDDVTSRDSASLFGTSSTIVLILSPPPPISPPDCECTIGRAEVEDIGEYERLAEDACDD
jgi:hypothetical protein